MYSALRGGAPCDPPLPYKLRRPNPPRCRASAGFPDHPHRGFETCSIMLSGRMEHADSMGNKVGGRAGRRAPWLSHCFPWLTRVKRQH